MIHIELGHSTIVGLGLIVIGLLLYALRIREPNVSRGVFWMSQPSLLACDQGKRGCKGAGLREARESHQRLPGV
jgi:hypothetical protein